MKKIENNKKQIANFGALLLILTGGLARAETLTDAGAFAWGTAGVRPMGMGGAFTAVADDANAVFVNPAGASLSTSRQLFYTQADLFNLKLIRQQQVAGVFPATANLPLAVGFGYSNLRVDFDPDTWTETVLALTVSRQILPLKEDAGLVTRKAVKLFLGITGKYLSVNSTFEPVTEVSQATVVTVSVDGGKAKGQSADVGLLLTSGDRWKVGLAVLDAASLLTWDSKTKESLVKRARLGVAGQPLKGLLLSAEPELSQQSGKLGVNRASAGLEARLAKLLPKGLALGKINDIALRGGLTRDLGDNTGGEFGGGLSVYFASFALDYALLSRQGSLGLTHRWGFGSSL